MLTGHEQLRVRVPVNEELDALAVLDTLDPLGQRLGLGGIAFALALEVLGARVVRRATADVPLVGPVTVDVVTEAVAARASLAVLAPHAVIRLGEEEAYSEVTLVIVEPPAYTQRAGVHTVRVDDREEKEVVGVEEPLDFLVISAIQQGVGKVLHSLASRVSISQTSQHSFEPATHHGRDPLPSVDGPVEHNSGLALALAAPEVNASDGIPVERLARSDNLSLVGELALQVVQVLQVVLVAMVRLEPCRVGRSGYNHG